MFKNNTFLALIWEGLGPRFGRVLGWFFGPKMHTKGDVQKNVVCPRNHSFNGSEGILQAMHAMQKIAKNRSAALRKRLPMTIVPKMRLGEALGAPQILGEVLEPLLGKAPDTLGIGLDWVWAEKFRHGWAEPYRCGLPPEGGFLRRPPKEASL